MTHDELREAIARIVAQGKCKYMPEWTAEEWEGWRKIADRIRALIDGGGLEGIVKDLQGMAQNYRFSNPEISRRIDGILLRSACTPPPALREVIGDALRKRQIPFATVIADEIMDLMKGIK